MGRWVMGVLQAVKLKLRINTSRMTSSYTNTATLDGKMVLSISFKIERG